MDARSAPMSSAELARTVETSQKKPQRLNEETWGNGFP
jgi:hypothetical protein